MQEKFANTIEEIWSRKSKKDKQHNGQKTKGQTMNYKIILRKLTIGQHKPHWQERLSSIIGPWEMECNGIPTYTTTRVEKLQMSIKLNIHLFYWYFQQNQCINKALGPYARVHAFRQHCPLERERGVNSGAVEG